MTHTIKGSIKEAAGYTKEELGESIDDAQMAREGRDLRNEGRMEKGKAPKLGEPGGGRLREDKDDEKMREENDDTL